MDTYHQCRHEGCAIIVPQEEYGSYCSEHRLDLAGCCLNHCTLDEEGAHCIMHCRDSIVRIINEAFENAKQRAFDLGYSYTCSELAELLDDFNNLNSPLIWIRKVLHLTSHLHESINIRNFEAFSYVSNQISFIRTVRNALTENDITKDNIINTIHSFAPHRLVHCFIELIEAIFANIDESEVDYYHGIGFADSDSELSEIFDEAYESMSPDIHAINEFHEIYQFVAPSMEKIEENLAKYNVKLCPGCSFPQSHNRLCGDCSNELGIVNPLM